MNINMVLLLASVRGREAAKMTDSFVIGQREREGGGATVKVAANRSAEKSVGSATVIWQSKHR